MTDARIPDRFLNDRRLRVLSDAEFRTYINTLVWAVANRNDGYFHRSDLRFVPDANPDHGQRMLSEGLWDVAPGDQMRIRDFEATQTSRAQLEGLELKKRQDATRSKNYRERRKAAPSRPRDEEQAEQVSCRPPESEEEKDAAWAVGIPHGASQLSPS